MYSGHHSCFAYQRLTSRVTANSYGNVLWLFVSKAAAGVKKYMSVGIIAWPAHSRTIIAACPAKISQWLLRRHARWPFCRVEAMRRLSHYHGVFQHFGRCWHQSTYMSSRAVFVVRINIEKLTLRHWPYFYWLSIVAIVNRRKWEWLWGVGMPRACM